MAEEKEFIYTKEYWSGDSRDGVLVNGDGYHYFKMRPTGLIIEAYEIYETDDGDEIVTAVPEMVNVGWITDLGFEDLEALDPINQWEFERIKSMTGQAEKV